MARMKAPGLIACAAFILLGCGPLDLRLTIDETVDPPQWKLWQTLTAGNDGSPGDLFGWSVDVCSSGAIVGAEGAAEGGTYRGAAYIFTRNPSTGKWGNPVKIVSNDPANSDLFGGAVAISTDHAVVASTGIPDEIEIFARDGASWSYVEDFSYGAIDFECALDLSGSHLLVGNKQAGTAAFYHFDGSTWSLKAPYSRAGGEYGRSVAVYGDWAIIGDPLFDDGAGDIGAVYFYQWSGSNWSELPNPLLPRITGEQVAGEQFGMALSLYKQRMIVGAPGTLLAYIYGLEGTQWSLEDTISISGVVLADAFGYSASMTDRMAAVGAYASAGETGRAYVVEEYSGAWKDGKPFAASGSAAADRFGYCVAIWEDYLFVGAPRHDNWIGADAGTVFVYRRDSITGVKGE